MAKTNRIFCLPRSDGGHQQCSNILQAKLALRTQKKQKDKCLACESQLTSLKQTLKEVLLSAIYRTEIKQAPCSIKWDCIVSSINEAVSEIEGELTNKHSGG